ncbi:MAG: hypothetical protein ACOCP6_02060 [Desulfosalsimonas sp.]
MKIFLAFFLVILAAFGGYHLSFRSVAGRRRLAWLHLTGLEFLVLGLLLGPGFFNVLDESTARSLEPLTALALGWIGLLLGFQFEVFQLRKFPPAFFLAMLVESTFTVLLSFCFFYFFLPLFFPLPANLQVVLPLVLAATAACTSQSGLALMFQGRGGRPTAGVRLVRYMASLDGLVPMAVLVFIFFARTREISVTPFQILFLLAAALAGIFIIYMFFLAQRRDADELALVIIGMTVVTSGTAAIAGFSPLLANFFMGVCLVNLTMEKEKIFHLLASIEKPVYLVLLIFLGASWHLPDFWIAVPALAYFIVRLAGKIAGGMSAVRLLPALRRGFPGLLGLGLVEQGGLAVAILFDFQQRFSGPEVSYVVGFALAAIVFAQLAGPYCAVLVLKRSE